MATNTKLFEGMFQELGIDTRTQEQILSARASNNLARAAAAPEGAERFAGQHDLRRAGQVFGSLLGNKIKPPELSEQEQIQVDAMSAAQTSFEEKQEAGDFLGKDGKADLTLESDGFNRAVAAELLKIGDPRGMELAQHLDVTQRQRAKDTQERVQGGLDIDESRRKGVESIYDFGRKKFLDKRGEISEVWVQGETDPNAGFSVFIDDNGNARTANGVDFELGAYTTSRPIAGKGGKGQAQSTLKDFMSVKEAGLMRAQQRGLIGQFDMAGAMLDALSDGVGDDGTLEVMGTGGKLTNTMVKLVDNIMTVGRALGGALSITDIEGNTLSSMNGSTASASKYARENQDLFSNDIIPEHIRDDADAVARYQAIIVQFAYGKARMNEEGNRITDSDFRNAVKQIGAAATSPDQLRQILVGDLNRAAETFDAWDQQFPDHIRTEVINQDARDIFDEKFANFNLRFGADFGTALAPTEALTNPPGRSTDFLDNNFTPTENAVLQGLEAEAAALQKQLDDLKGT